VSGRVVSEKLIHAAILGEDSGGDSIVVDVSAKSNAKIVRGFYFLNFGRTVSLFKMATRKRLAEFYGEFRSFSGAFDTRNIDHRRETPYAIRSASDGTIGTVPTAIYVYMHAHTVVSMVVQ